VLAGGFSLFFRQADLAADQRFAVATDLFLGYE
jgi:hypothetical protein